MAYGYVTPPFILWQYCFKVSQYLFLNTMSLRIIRNPSNMGNIKMSTKHLKCLTVIASSIICFDLIWNTKHKINEYRQWLLTFLVASPVKTVATGKLEKVSVVTCTYFNFPKSEIWVTSIRDNLLGMSPRGLTPLCGTGKNWGH